MNEFDIEFSHVSKKFESLTAVDDISFTVEKGKFHSFLGASGCGKTTSLRMIAGFEQPSSGTVKIAGQNMNGIPAHQRSVNMVFQHYALFPHLNVVANVGYGLAYHKPKLSPKEIALRAEAALDMVKMLPYKNRRIWELSGGQQQRVALARALVNKPTVLLLDEPLAALDRKLRKEMQTELLRLQREVGITFVMVTHDQEEALSLSDQISVMRDGKILQTASPQTLYEHPNSAYIADFIGESNLIAGKVSALDGETVSITTDNDFSLSGMASDSYKAFNHGDDCCLSIRPDALQLKPKNGADRFVATVTDRIFLGSITEYHLHSRELGELTARVPIGPESAVQFEHGNEVAVNWSEAAARALPK